MTPYSQQIQDILDSSLDYTSKMSRALDEASLRNPWAYTERRASYCANAVRKALKSGALVKPQCCACGQTPVMAHHFDYRKPLEVHWCCAKCHRRIHRNLRMFAHWAKFLEVCNWDKLDAHQLKSPTHNPKTGLPKPEKVFQYLWRKTA